MISYECNILCDGHRCDEIVTGEPVATPEEARISAEQEAICVGWTKLDDGRWICPECPHKLTVALRSQGPIGASKRSR